MLLTIVNDSISFEDLRTWDGVVHPNFKSASHVDCSTLMSNEIALWQKQSYDKVDFNCVNCLPVFYSAMDIFQLWINHAEHLSNGCRHQLQTILQIVNSSEDQVWLRSNVILTFNRSTHLLSVLFEIFSVRTQNNSDLDEHNLSLPTHEFAPVIPNVNRLILEECGFNVDILRDTIERDSMCLNVDQRIAFDTLCEAVVSREGGVFFLEGFGGTGKTFLINLMLAKVQSNAHWQCVFFLCYRTQMKKDYRDLFEQNPTSLHRTKLIIYHIWFESILNIPSVIFYVQTVSFSRIFSA